MPDTPSNNNYASKSARFVSESQGLTDNTTKQTNATAEQSIKSPVIENGAIRDYLKSIDLTTKEILRKGVSQSSAKDRIKDEKSKFQNAAKEAENRRSATRDSDSKKSTEKKRYGTFSEGAEDAFWEEILGKDFKDQMSSIVSGFAKDFGVNLKDVQGELGNQLMHQGMQALKNTKFGQAVQQKIDDVKASAFSKLSQAFDKGAEGGKSYGGDALRDVANRMKGKEASPAAETIKNAAPETISKVGSILKDKGLSTAATESGDLGSTVASVVGDAIGGSVPGAEIATKAVANVATDAAADMATAAAGNAAATASLTTASTEAAAGLAAAGGTAGTAGTAIAGLSSVAAAAGPILLAVLIGIELLTDAVGPAIEGFKKFGAALKKSANRQNETDDRRAELAKDRLKADIRTIVEEPFNILKEAAQAVYQAWDSNLRLINQTQGYTKSDLQDLMAIYAQRLRDENLSKYVSGSDITANLTKVLESGLSGQVAEEFAYVATKLNAAIPTEDFFQYSSTYASIAANQIKAGMSQTDAIQYATKQLESFASSLLYSSRQLAGGFSSGLKNASSLFEESVKITQAAKTGNASQLSAVMTAVSAATGAIAPDLASSMTDAIVKAATGGNSSQIVALRSLAGVNAGNTEFLNQLVSDPQRIFSTLFENLAKMQNMSNDNFMEVAEGLSDVFGVSMDAFARIDFNYLANAIKNMNTSDASLNENITNLKSGQSTTNADILKNQQINQYIIENGLSLVLDNEAARTIQEHMWDEQMMQQIQETTYGVEIQGAALELLSGIRQTIRNLMNMLNPIGWLVKTVSNVSQSVTEGEALKDDVAKILQLGAVGQGNAKSFYQLTTRGKELNVTNNLVELLGGRSSYQLAGDIYSAVRDASDIFSPITSGTFRLADSAAEWLLNRDAWNNYAWQEAYNTITGKSKPTSVSSKYTWGTISKSLSKSLSASSRSTSLISSAASNSALAESQQQAADRRSTEILQSNFNRMKDTIQTFVDDNKSYDEWKATARNYGISDFDKAINKLGYAEADLQGYFEALQGQKGAQAAHDRQQKEEDFWAMMSTNDDSQMNQLISLKTAGNDILTKILETTSAFKQMFNDYFVEPKWYANTYDSAAVAKIQKDEKYQASDAIYKLAEAITASNNLDNPTVQTNALLGQILIVVQSIMQQNNTKGKLTIPDAIAAMATGQMTVEAD